MDIQEELLRIVGEAQATQVILAGICLGLAANGEAGRFIVTNALECAEAVKSSASLQLGSDQPQAHLEGMMKVIAHVRLVALGEDRGDA